MEKIEAISHKLIRIFTILFLVFLSGLFKSDSTFAQLNRDLSSFTSVGPNGRNPLFRDADQFLVFMNYKLFSHDERKIQESLPSFLQKENLKKKFIQKLETHIGASKRKKQTDSNILERFIGKNSANPKIIFTENYDEFKKYNDLANSENTLTLIFQVTIEGGDSFDPSLNHPIAGMFLYAYKPGQDLESLIWLRTIKLLSLNEDKTILENEIDLYLESWMRKGR